MGRLSQCESFTERPWRWSRGALITETFTLFNPQLVTQRHRTSFVSVAFSKGLDTTADLTGTFNRVLQDRNGPETFARCTTMKRRATFEWPAGIQPAPELAGEEAWGVGH
jgi:hypothetical protein